MEALTEDDLLPLEEFASRRREFLANHLRYLDRYRRVRLGPRAMLVFENRQTIWFRLQEVLRIARIADSALIRSELDLYNQLLPQRDRLQASLLLQVEEARLIEELTPWRELRGDQLILQIANIRLAANLLTCRPEDQAIGTTHWVQFVIDDAAKTALAQRHFGMQFSVSLPSYHHESGPLSDEVRFSLLDDLEPGTRDRAA